MPFVAMTREMGSLGKDVAAGLAERLGRQVVHHEIIDNLASKMRLRKSHVVRFLEGKSGIWERLTTDKTSLSIYTADETFALAESGKVAVIRGWGATHLLRPVPHVVSVRVCAPFEVRVKRMMERLNTDDRDFVENEIRMSEEAHAAITKRHFGINWQESEHYDLVLNTERLTIDECVDEVMTLLDDATFEETAASQRVFGNLALTAHVRAALRQDERTSRFQIVVKAEDGVVTLAGLIDPGQEPMHSIEVTSKVPGVKNVLNRVRTAVPGARHIVEG
ncbi:MAG TPA: cytidylate kinase family protein [Burkholderiales bacterium]|jgi:cytidylate kinase|nr:cytidylate kinase family protein [Burkholderiales bacterium]